MPENTIRTMIRAINNEDENGGIWLPLIQRPFVWDERRIELLCDSIMRKYPISTLLLWRTKNKLKLRKFYETYKKDIPSSTLYTAENERAKSVVLDGQQRLQALYLALKGSYEGKELYFNVKNTHDEGEESKYDFKFSKPDLLKETDGWFKLKELVFSEMDTYQLGVDLSGRVLGKVNPNDTEVRGKIQRNVSLLIQHFVGDNAVVYHTIDSIDNPATYTIDDVVEVFIRANSGGVVLSKSDLLFSLTTADWQEFQQELEDLQSSLDSDFYTFDRDFILKSCLICIGEGARYKINKFRENDNIKKIRDHWDSIKKSLFAIKDFLYAETYIRSGKALTSYNALLPLIYFYYNHPKKWRAVNKTNITLWLIRVLLVGAFSGSSDTTIDKLSKQIDVDKDFIPQNLNKIIEDGRRAIHLTSDAIFEIKYNEKESHLLLSLLYPNIDFYPNLEDNLPSQDHIFPKAKLSKIRLNPDSNEKKYNKAEIDQIANLQIMPLSLNRDEKRSLDPIEWLTKQSQEYLATHYIPTDKKLWEMENYKQFIEARKELILKRLKDLDMVIQGQ